MIEPGIIQVGAGRGFVVEGCGNRFVITAGHCLPELPPCYSFSALHERTYRNLIGSLGGASDVWAECLFVDPIADLAVLGCPDGAELNERADAYRDLTGPAAPLPIAALPLADTQFPPWEGRARLLSLDNRWSQCKLMASHRALWIQDAAEPIVGGMSGSPIMVGDAAVGVLCVSAGQEGDGHVAGGPNPFLAAHLPGWLLKEMGIAEDGGGPGVRLARPAKRTVRAKREHL